MLLFIYWMEANFEITTKWYETDSEGNLVLHGICNTLHKYFRWVLNILGGANVGMYWEREDLSKVEIYNLVLFLFDSNSMEGFITLCDI